MTVLIDTAAPDAAEADAVLASAHDLTVAGTYNVRGIGIGALPWLVRAAALDMLDADGERTLRTLGVDLVIDLREPSERGPRTHTLPVAGIPLYGAAPPAAGTLESVYTQLIASCGTRLTAAVAAIADHAGTPVVHCAAGKDRTGLVVALARLAAGDAESQVVADYARSGDAVRPARLALVALQLAGQGLDAPERARDRADAERLHLDSPAEALATALRLVDGWGGPAAYLTAHGMTEAQLARLRTKALRSADARVPA